MLLLWKLSVISSLFLSLEKICEGDVMVMLYLYKGDLG